MRAAAGQQVLTDVFKFAVGLEHAYARMRINNAQFTRTEHRDGGLLLNVDEHRGAVAEHVHLQSVCVVQQLSPQLGKRLPRKEARWRQQPDEPALLCQLQGAVDEQTVDVGLPFDDIPVCPAVWVDLGRLELSVGWIAGQNIGLSASSAGEVNPSPLVSMIL